MIQFDIRCRHSRIEISSDELAAKFNALRHIALGWISLESSHESLVPGVPVHQLQSLKLQCCPMVTMFLSGLTRAARDIQVTFQVSEFFQRPRRTVYINP
ncbi:hypothetical protein BJX70DRAFT_319013 [Aspergillus crustosus]